MKDPKKTYLNDMKYESQGEYLSSLFVLLDLLIFKDPYERMRDRGLSAAQDPEEWMGIIPDRAELTLQCGESLAIEEAMEKTRAPWFMRIILAFLLRCVLDPSYEAAAAAECGRENMTLYELCRICAVPEDREDPAAVCAMLEEMDPCLELLFPQLFRREQASGQSIAGLLPVMDGRLVSILLGRDKEDHLPRGMQLYVPGMDAETGTADQENSVLTEEGPRQCAEILLKRTEAMPPETVVLWGRGGSGKRTAMKAFAEEDGRTLMFYDMSDTLEEKENRQEGAPREKTVTPRLYSELLLLRRECVLSDCIPVITGLQLLQKEDQQELQRFLSAFFLRETGSVYLLAETEDAPDDLPESYFLPMREFRSIDRIRLWKKVLPADAEITDAGIEALSNTFDLTPGQIREAAAQAVRLAGPEEQVTEELVYQVCYAKLGHPLKKHTQRVRSPFTWDDLKMNSVDKAVLKDLCGCVRNRHIVMQEWNFEKKVPYGAGITALFAGPPGTGKTMAAQVIANELKMELYKVDLSQLMDKYVGETEKNIKRIFELAGRSNSVLFFDEADAIFNKRLSAESSNDRFANIESSLLLQCIEEFSGVTLLATNNMASIDVAFLRRFRFYLQFKEPDEEIRFQIWSSVFPAEAPVDPEVDFQELARMFRFTGAVIKNVAMQAAYLAAERGKGIGMLEILVAVRRELEKEQRMLSRDSMGRFEYLFPEVVGWNSSMERSSQSQSDHL